MSGFNWNTGNAIQDDVSYFRNDDSLVQECMSPVGHSLIRVLGIRRFGKTSFLNKLERHLLQQRNWLCCSISIQVCHDNPAFTAHHNNIKKIKQKLSKNQDLRAMFLIDELNSVADPRITDEKRRKRAKLISEIVRISTSGEFGNRFKTVISEASNIDERLDYAPFDDSETIDQIKDGSTLFLPRFLWKEKTDLLQHVEGVPFDQIPAAMLDYVGGHPLLIQLLGLYIDQFKKPDLTNFKLYLASNNAGAAYDSIFRDLHSLEKLVLRRLVYEKGPLPESAFTSTGGVDGISVVSRLREFGLVEGTGAGEIKIGVPAIGEYIRQTCPIPPQEDVAESLITQWRTLFFGPHPNDSGTVSSFIIHHMADLHLPSDYDGTGHRMLDAYGATLERLERNSPFWRPHVMVLAGDLLKQDRGQIDFRSYDSPLENLRSYLSEKMTKHGQRINANLSQFIVVAGDTDATIQSRPKVGERGKKVYTSDFYLFDKGFKGFWQMCQSPQYFQDWNIVIVPLNSANPTDIEDMQAVSELRSKLQEAKNNFSEMYEIHRRLEYGSLPDDLGKLLEREIAKLRPHDDRGDFDHALRIGVFHHHLEQLSFGNTVDFKGAEKVKQALAHNEISVLLHGHAHRTLVFTETYYSHHSNNRPWTSHAICCGAMFEDSETGSPRSFNSLRITRESADPDQRECARNRGATIPKFCYTVEVRPYNMMNGSFSESDSNICLEVVR